MLLTQVPGAQDDHQAIGDCVSCDRTCNPELSDLYKGDDKKSVCRGMQHGKCRKASKTSERCELMFHGDRKRDEGNQEKRQVEVVFSRLLEEGGLAMYERNRQGNGNAATGNTDHQGDVDRFRNSCLSRHDKVLSSFLSAWSEDRTQHNRKRNTQGVTASSFRKQYVGQDSLRRKGKNDLADLGREHDGGVLTSGRIRTWQSISTSRHRFLFCGCGLSPKSQIA